MLIQNYVQIYRDVCEITKTSAVIQKQSWIDLLRSNNKKYVKLDQVSGKKEFSLKKI